MSSGSDNKSGLRTGNSWWHGNLCQNLRIRCDNTSNGGAGDNKNFVRNGICSYRFCSLTPGSHLIITNSRYALVGYFITSYPTRAHGIIGFAADFYFNNLQSGKFVNLAHHFSYDVKLRILADSRSFLANQKARNAIVGAENLLKRHNNIDLTT